VSAEVIRAYSVAWAVIARCARVCAPDLAALDGHQPITPSPMFAVWPRATPRASN
jgi:hypothetical protein